MAFLFPKQRINTIFKIVFNPNLPNGTKFRVLFSNLANLPVPPINLSFLCGLYFGKNGFKGFWLHRAKGTSNFLCIFAVSIRESGSRTK